MATVDVSTPPPAPLSIRLHRGRDLEHGMGRWAEYVSRTSFTPLSRHPAWLHVLRDGLGHTPYCLEAVAGDRTRGLLPLAEVDSLLFGRFLVSLPYVNHGGVLADDDATAAALIDAAVNLADVLEVRYLELRQGEAIDHPALPLRMSGKVHMRRPLPPTPELLWEELNCKVRNQVRKARKHELTVAWGGEELLGEFHAVFSRNMRDLGTPTYGKGLFASILRQFPDRAELCVVRAGAVPVASALLTHGWGVTEVPSASALRQYNATCANMLMYWHLLERASQRGQSVFDFGRSSRDSNTYRFKDQWGAKEAPADWLYHLRIGEMSAMRPENPRYQRLIRMWQRLPVWLTRLLGPRIVRGIP